MRRIGLVKWSSLVSSSCVGAAWTLSLFLSISYHWEDRGTGDHNIRLENGCITLFSVYGMCRGFGSSGEPDPGYFHIAGPGPPLSFGMELPSYFRDPPGPLRNRQAFVRLVSVPLWIPFILFMALVGLSLKRGSRSLLWNQCGTCGNDLTGNESGICPECGTTTARQGICNTSRPAVTK